MHDGVVCRPLYPVRCRRSDEREIVSIIGLRLSPVHEPTASKLTGSSLITTTSIHGGERAFVIVVLTGRCNSFTSSLSVSYETHALSKLLHS